MLDSVVKTQQQQKTNKNNKKNQLSKHNKAKSSHSPGPTACSPCQSSANYGNTEITRHALKVKLNMSETSLSVVLWTLHGRGTFVVGRLLGP